MAINYTWSFPQLDVVYSEDGKTNVVQAVHWIYLANEGNYYDQMVGCTPMNAPGRNFVDYNNLTPEIVTGWVVNKLGQEKIDEMTAELATRIEAMKAPKSGTENPPWANPAPTPL